MNAVYSPFMSTPGANNDFFSTLRDLAGDFLTGVGAGIGAGQATNTSPTLPGNGTFNGTPGMPTTGTPNPTGVNDVMTKYGPLIIGGGVLLAAVLLLRK